MIRNTRGKKSVKNFEHFAGSCLTTGPYMVMAPSLCYAHWCSSMCVRSSPPWDSPNSPVKPTPAKKPRPFGWEVFGLVDRFRRCDCPDI